MSYAEIVGRIEKLRDKPARVEEAARFAEALEQLGLEFPADGDGVILIAGTNGKGSVAKTLETLIFSHDEAVGLFSSPHMMSTTERIRSFGRDLSEDEFVAAFIAIEAKVDVQSLSHFQILTLMMAEVFFGGRLRPRVKYAAIEVGVGGRLDPTRSIPHATAVVTRLGLDHVELLTGLTAKEPGALALIAREKFAIADGARLLVTAPLDEIENEIGETLESLKQNENLRVVRTKNLLSDIELHEGRPVWKIFAREGEATLNLKGARAVENTSVALTVLRELKFPVAKMLSELANVQWPCRMEGFRVRRVDGERTLFLSGDHNLQGIESLREILACFDYDRLLILAGFAVNKPADEMIRALAMIPRAQLLVTLTPFRTSGPENFQSLPPGVGFEAEPEKALEGMLAKASLERDLVVVTGSLYLTGFLRRRLVEGRFGTFESFDDATSIAKD